MRLASPVIAAFIVAVVVLAGCNEPKGGSGPSSSSSSTSDGWLTGSTSSSSSATEAPSDFVEVRREFTSFVQVNDLNANRTVRLFQTPEQRDEAFATTQNCNAGDDGREYFWYGVWNRTGLVLYEQRPAKPVKDYGTIDLTFTLPNDPPFLLWSGATCIGKVTWQFHSSDWHKAPTGRGVPETPGAIDETLEEFVSIHVPAGTTEADGFFNVEGKRYMVEGQAIQGAWENENNGPILGEILIYEPGEPDWFIRNAWTLTDDGDWEWTHGERGKGGAYRYHIKLTTPNLAARDLTAHLWVYNFQEDELQAQGFQVPFKSYV